jgi:hypothetical protein
MPRLRALDFNSTGHVVQLKILYFNLVQAMREIVALPKIL